MQLRSICHIQRHIAGSACGRITSGPYLSSIQRTALNGTSGPAQGAAGQPSADELLAKQPSVEEVLEEQPAAEEVVEEQPSVEEVLEAEPASDAEPVPETTAEAKLEEEES